MYWADTTTQHTNDVALAFVERPRFFFGAMSPYSWFAAERIDGLIPDARWIPVFAGALFRANGRGTWGLTERREAGIAECEARAAAHGLAPIVWPDPWPTNDVTVARAMAFADDQGRLHEFALAAMRLAFREGGELGDLSVIQAAGARTGIDPERLAHAITDQAVKDRVRANHDQAMELGVFGVPTVVLRDDQAFWGDDRLEEAAAEARAGGL
jgi:2-hydroxychromene-2-carboxylate isomerase